MGNNDEVIKCDKDEIKFDKCEMFAEKNFSTVVDNCGRLVIARVNLCNVIRNRTIAVAVLLFQDGKLKAFKATKVYSGHSECCRIKKLYVGRFYFILPDVDLCSYENVKIKVIAHYTDINRCMRSCRC